MTRQNGSSRIPTSSPQADFTVESFSSVFFVRCENESAKQALLRLDEPGPLWFGDRLAVEPRFIGRLLSSLREGGWRIR